MSNKVQMRRSTSFLLPCGWLCGWLGRGFLDWAPSEHPSAASGPPRSRAWTRGGTCVPRQPRSRMLRGLLVAEGCKIGYLSCWRDRRTHTSARGVHRCAGVTRRQLPELADAEKRAGPVRMAVIRRATRFFANARVPLKAHSRLIRSPALRSRKVPHAGRIGERRNGSGAWPVPPGRHCFGCGDGTRHWNCHRRSESPCAAPGRGFSLLERKQVTAPNAGANKPPHPRDLPRAT